MNKLIGRLEEKEILLDALLSKKAEFIAVYGRRRIGKTFLVRTIYEKHLVFEYTGLNKGNHQDQLNHFSKSLTNITKKEYNISSWFDAFDNLKEYLNLITKNKKKVVFIDEFPWLDTPRSKFLMAFEAFWNEYASRKNDLIIVICGSAASYMVQKIVMNKGGLHNRLTQKIRLMPFNLKEVKEFLLNNNIKYSDYDILQIYMIMGGIPFYLEKLKKGESVTQSIDRLCFTKDGILRNEFNIVFSSLYSDSEKHTEIIKTLSGVRKGLNRNEISIKSKISTGGALTNTIQELIESGFVTQYLPFGKKSKDMLYRLTDEYTMFYLKFIHNSKAIGIGSWMQFSSNQSYKTWLGFSFEIVCLKHIEQIKKGLGISGVYTEQANWTEKNDKNGIQIDLLIDRNDNIINICEMKYSLKEFTIDKKYAEEIKNKRNMFIEHTKSKKNINITMLTTYGIKENIYSKELIQNNLKINCLFNS